MDTINSQISKNLKQIRKDKGLTLEDVSDVSGVSKSMLGEIERGGTNPTILVLWKIAEGLRIPLTDLIRDEEPDYTIVRSTDEKILNQDSEYGIYSIFPYYEQHRNEILRLEILPGSELTNTGHMNGMDEYIFVIRGTVRLTLDGTNCMLNEGDSIRFHGALPHRFHNGTQSTAVLLNVLNYK